MRTDEKLKEICDNLRQTYGDLHVSARRAGVSIDFVTNWMRDDKVAADEIEEARRVGYMGLESVAIERAVHGVEKGVYFKGEKVGIEIQHSDTLLVKLLEARVPAFNKKEAANTFNGPTQINIMPRAENFEQWMQMKELTLKARDQQKALPAPNSVPEVLQGEYVEVRDDAPLAGLRGLL